MCMKTVHDNKGTGVSKASSFDLHGREEHAAVGDPSEIQRMACVGRLRPLTVTGAHRRTLTEVLFFLPEFGAKLEKDICGDTSGYYQKLLVILLQVQQIKKRAAASLFLDNESLWCCCYQSPEV